MFYHDAIHIDISKIDVSKAAKIIDDFAYLTELNLDKERIMILKNITHRLSAWKIKALGEILSLTEDDLTDDELIRLRETSGNPDDIDNNNPISPISTSVSIIINLPDILSDLSDLTGLSLDDDRLTSLIESIGNFSFMDGQFVDKPIDLNKLDLRYEQLTILPDNIAKLSNLTTLNLELNQLTSLPELIGNLSRLTELNLENNQLVSLPESIGNLINLTKLDLGENQLTSLPESIGNLSSLRTVDLGGNQLTSLPESTIDLNQLYSIHLCDTLVDLSILKDLTDLKYVSFLNIFWLPRRYWTKLTDWKSEWLLDENNAEIRRILVDRIGYERICDELNAVSLDTWREYTLLKIDGVETVYEDGEGEPIGREPMLLLKMTCPSTAHIHILRVPPEIVSAEAAITWINHGIHPDRFAIQT